MSTSITNFRTKARAWLESNVPSDPPPLDGVAARDYSLAWQKVQAQGGWAGLSWPKEVGGCGLSVLVSRSSLSQAEP